MLAVSTPHHLNHINYQDIINNILHNYQPHQNINNITTIYYGDTVQSHFQRISVNISAHSFSPCHSPHIIFAGFSFAVILTYLDLYKKHTTSPA